MKTIMTKDKVIEPVITKHKAAIYISLERHGKESIEYHAALKQSYETILQYWR